MQYTYELLSLSDSQAAIAAIDSSEVTSQAVLDTKVALNSLAKLTRNTVLVWIKAHVGHQGNEVADEMAKQGTTSSNNIKVGIPLCETKRLVEEFIRGEWDKEWNNYKEGKQSKEFLLGNDKTRAKKLLELLGGIYQDTWDLLQDMATWRTLLLRSKKASTHYADSVLKEMKPLYILRSCLLYTSPSPRDKRQSRMPSSA